MTDNKMSENGSVFGLALFFFQMNWLSFGLINVVNKFNNILKFWWRYQTGGHIKWEG
jgi:hypothetical protein